jgi:hypothetical protein
VILNGKVTNKEEETEILMDKLLSNELWFCFSMFISI